MLQTCRLQFAYNRQTAFTYPDITCHTAAPLLITGSSGIGKTTLLHLLGCLLKPSRGEVHINGINTSALKNRTRDQFRGQHIGIIYQSAHFMQALPVLDNIVLPQYFTGIPIDTAKARNIATRLQIAHLLHKYPHQLSKGEQQRASIARALINEPALVLADEPTSSLDDENTERVIQLIKEQTALSNATLIVVTHDARVKKHFSNHQHIG